MKLLCKLVFGAVATLVAIFVCRWIFDLDSELIEATGTVLAFMGLVVCSVDQQSQLADERRDLVQAQIVELEVKHRAYLTDIAKTRLEHAALSTEEIGQTVDDIQQAWNEAHAIMKEERLRLNKVLGK